MKVTLDEAPERLDDSKSTVGNTEDRNGVEVGKRNEVKTEDK